METLEKTLKTPDPGTVPSNGIVTGVANLANLFYKKRDALGLSIKDVAERADITPALLKKIESYRAVPRYDTVLKLCAIYGFAIDVYVPDGDVKSTCNDT